nr:hypothetical protein [Tanacetum cinerariifolium]
MMDKRLHAAVGRRFGWKRSLHDSPRSVYSEGASTSFNANMAMCQMNMWDRVMLRRKNMTWNEMTCDDLWRKVYTKREDLDQFEITKIGKVVKKTQEDLDDLMNQDHEDTPKMKKKKEEDGEPVVFQ